MFLASLLLLLLSILRAVSARKDSIFCLIHTTASAHESRLATILETWAKKCDDKLVFTDAPLSDDIPHVYFPFMATRDHSWEKIRRVFRYVYETTNNSFDWYLRADDDSYVVMENARKLVAEHDPKKPLVLGYRWGFFEPRGYVDGGVYVLGRCMAKVGIYPTDTRDAQGRERFHHFHVDEFENRWLTEFVKQNAFYGYKQFPQEISDTSVSFHHVSPYESQVLEYLIHRHKRGPRRLPPTSDVRKSSLLRALKAAF
ncbi:hypothetical protein M3Y99_01723100 [Aphelenchoides fujianensis]|nr:hypothetical protein M3Y99_01723100 [Aphelenchoides fujianensis]